jgi:N-acetylglucosaminyldiphosphoundecaprenol N-acetyl-beta-D-mannosaminyltransferase
MSLVFLQQELVSKNVDQEPNIDRTEKGRDMKKDQTHVKILGVKLSSTTKTQVLMEINKILTNPRLFMPNYTPVYIVTPNPEQVYYAQKDKRFKNFLNDAKQQLPDGIGLATANKFLNFSNPKNKIIRLPVLLLQGLIVGVAALLNKTWLTRGFEIIHGRNITEDIFALAERKTWRVCLLSGVVGNIEVAKKSEEILLVRYPKLIVKGITAPIYDENANPVNESEISKEKSVIESIKAFKPHLLFVGMTPPKQEMWLKKNLKKLPVGVAMAVGGTFSYISGVVPPPPKWISIMELEWLWRLFSQKGRVKRVLTAFPIFPLRVFWYKLTIK